MTKRAERLAEFLENAGWTVFDEEPVSTCRNCGHSSEYGKYCSNCGKKMPGAENHDAETYEFLESAIKYALKREKKQKKEDDAPCVKCKYNAYEHNCELCMENGFEDFRPKSGKVEVQNGKVYV